MSTHPLNLGWLLWSAGRGDVNWLVCHHGANSRGIDLLSTCRFAWWHGPMNLTEHISLWGHLAALVGRLGTPLSQGLGFMLSPDSKSRHDMCKKRVGGTASILYTIRIYFSLHHHHQTCRHESWL